MATKTAEKPAKKGAAKKEPAGGRRAASTKQRAKAPAAKPKAADRKAKPAAAKKSDKAPAAPKKSSSLKTSAKKSVSVKEAPKAAAAKAAAKGKAAKAAPADAAKGKKAPAEAKAAAPKTAPAKNAKSAKAAAEKAKKAAAAAKKKPETPAKKPLVGQKPRTQKAAVSIDGSVPPPHLKASASVNNTPVKASPASAEAKQDFKVNDHVVYPAHGVGRIVSIEKQLIAGIANELFLIDFEQEKMKLRVPTAKAKAVGMRPLSDPALVKKAIETLKGRARIKRTMWSRRAQEYEAKINSGDIISVAEVVRDLYRATDQPEQSYSERQLFEAALDRLAREVAAVHKSTLDAALGELDASLKQKKAA